MAALAMACTKHTSHDLYIHNYSDIPLIRKFKVIVEGGAKAPTEALIRVRM